MMTKRIWLSQFFFCLLPILAFASIHPIATIGVGLVKAHIANTTTIGMISPFSNTYLSDKSFDTRFMNELFLGAEFSGKRNVAWQLGASYAQNSPFITSGKVWQFNDSDLANLSYSYKILSRRLMLASKIIWQKNRIFSPYLMGGVGDAINRTYGYAEKPLDSTAIGLKQPFKSNTDHSLTYALGAGLETELSPKVRLGIGYRFVNLGKIGLSTSPLQDSNDTIKLKHLFAHELVFHLSFLG